MEIMFSFVTSERQDAHYDGWMSARDRQVHYGTPGMLRVLVPTTYNNIRLNALKREPGAKIDLPRADGIRRLFNKDAWLTHNNIRMLELRRLQSW